MSTFSALRQKAGLSVAEAAIETGYCERQAYRWERGEIEPRKVVLERLKAFKPSSGSHQGAAFTFIDLFAGIGGIRLGFEGIGGRCIFTSEWDKYAAKTYAANFPNDDHEIAGDITKIPSLEIPDHDLLLAGFPCQPFSIAGVSKKNALNRPHGFACETQGTLFHDVARVIRDKKPAAFVLENVKNLVSHDKGNTFKIITAVLREELGYHITTRVIDGKSFVPQHRERIIIVGFRDANGFSLNNLIVPDPLQGPKLSTILHRKGDPADRQFTEENGLPHARYTLTDHLWKYLQGYAEKHRLKGNGFGFGLVGPNDVTRTLSARYYKDGSEILVRQGNGSPRRLTPRECARLMGFDKPGKTSMRIPVSDTQAYKQFGNSVVVPAIEAVAQHMQPALLQAIAKARAEHAVHN
jgi:DNA (cytosine-5)-methyltransferase 1